MHGGNWKETERHVRPAAIAEEKAAGRQVVGFLSDAEPRHVTGQPARRAFQWLLFLTICLSLVKVSSAAYSEGHVGLASQGHLVGTKGHSDEALTTAQALNMKWVSKQPVWVLGLNSPWRSHGEAKPSQGQSTTQGPNHSVLPAWGSHLPDNHCGPQRCPHPKPRTCENVQLHGQGSLALLVEFNLLVCGW